MSAVPKENRNGEKLLCDGAHCLPRAEFRPRGTVTDIYTLLRLARRQCWTFRRGITEPTVRVDLCPSCSEKADDARSRTKPGDAVPGAPGGKP